MDSEVAVYFKAVPAARKPHVDRLHALVMKCFPRATLTMKYRMPTYHYGDGWVAIANQKNYVSLYTCDAAHLARFRKVCPAYKTGKGCINFREQQVIPEAAVIEVIEHAMRYPKGG